uniref:Sortilin N-terminal domain-containing protein n=1 Tax=uncultured marine thaumarchaeote KM3_72_A09 TaxID=1456261 RepID=A0A075HJ55_9ARCH|nr:hypothetical protein [uncultured marine thaumarchaeote KM3_72_A09]
MRATVRMSLLQVKQIILCLTLIIFVFFPYPSVSASVQLQDFNWQSRPMQSGDIAQIAVSQTNPDIMYLGVEVNMHSMYKSEDGGHSWRRIHLGDHAKDVAVHPTDPDTVLYSDSQSVWLTTNGGREEGHVSIGPFRRMDPFEKVLDGGYSAGPSSTSFSSIAIASSDPNVVYTSIRGEKGRGDGPQDVWGEEGRRGPSREREMKGQLFRSTDGGTSFTEILGSFPVFLVLLIDPFDENRIFAGSSDGVYLSVDGGSTFSLVAKSKGIATIDTVDGQTILAGGEEGILHSEDRGLTWIRITDGLPSHTVLRVRWVQNSPDVVWATTLDGVARSADGGKSWIDVSGSPDAGGLPARNLKALAVHPTNPDIALVATETFVFSVRSTHLFSQGQYYGQGIYRTEDGGMTWLRSDGGLIEDNLMDITAHPTRPFEVWASQQASRGMYRSTDAGQTWSLSPHLLTHYPMRVEFFPDDPDGVVMTGSHNGENFGITGDSGVNWAILSERTFFDSLGHGRAFFDESRSQGSNLHLHGLAIHPSNPEVIFVGSVDDRSAFSEKALEGSHIFKSTDRGGTWVEFDEGYDHSSPTSINDIKIDPSNTNTMYIGTSSRESVTANGIWKSEDGGEFWHRADTGMENDASVSGILIHPTNGNLLLTGTSNGIYRSVDGAASWELVHEEWISDMEYDPTQANVVYSGGPKGVFVSTNFGESWKNISNNLPVGGDPYPDWSGYGQKPNGEVNAVAVNSDGKVVYVDVSGFGLFVAVDPSVDDIPRDNTTGVHYGGRKIVVVPEFDAVVALVFALSLIIVLVMSRRAEFRIARTELKIH